MGILLDDWQRAYIEYDGDKVLVAGRQTGKSEAQAYDCGEFAVKHPNTTTLIISKTERQAQELLIKVLSYLQEFYPSRIGKGEHKPLKNELWVSHGGKRYSRVICKPVGLAGEGVRGLTIDKLAPDEAQLISDDVFDAVTPMLLTTGGHIGMTGTPQGKRGFFWKAFENKQKHYKVFHINSEQVGENRPISPSWPEWRKQAFFEHLKKEKERMSPKRYKQEYLGEFVEDLDQVFSDIDIEACCIGNRGEKFKRTFLGVDVGRTTDPTSFQILEGSNPKKIYHLDSISRGEYSIPRTCRDVLELNNTYKFKSIGVDGGGLGIGVVDMLLSDSKVRDKVFDLNNSKRVIEKGDTDRQSKLIKEAMYFNLQRLMINREIVLLNDDEVKASLRSCQIEYIEGSKEVKIWGNDTHITEGLIRAAWLIKEQGLSIWAF